MAACLDPCRLLSKQGNRPSGRPGGCTRGLRCLTLHGTHLRMPNPGDPSSSWQYHLRSAGHPQRCVAVPGPGGFRLTPSRRRRVRARPMAAHRPADTRAQSRFDAWVRYRLVAQRVGAPGTRCGRRCVSTAGRCRAPRDGASPARMSPLATAGAPAQGGVRTRDRTCGGLAAGPDCAVAVRCCETAPGYASGPRTDGGGSRCDRSQNLIGTNSLWYVGRVQRRSAPQRRRTRGSVAIRGVNPQPRAEGQPSP